MRALLGLALLALVPLAPKAHAQGDYENWYVIGTDAKAVFDPTNPIGSPVLTWDNGNVPPKCPEGFFYQISPNVLGVCGSEAKFDLIDIGSNDVLPTGEHYPAGAMLLVRKRPGGTDDEGPSAPE